MGLQYAVMGADEKNPRYQLYSKYWTPYSIQPPLDLYMADDATIGLFHLDKKAEVSDEEMKRDLDKLMETGESEGEANFNLEQGSGAGDEKGKRNVKDSSIQEDNALAVGELEWREEGRFDGSAVLNEKSAIVTGPYNVVESGDAFTAEAWFHPDNNEQMTLISLVGFSEKSLIKVARGTDKKIRVRCGETEEVLNTSAPTKTWTHIAMVVTPKREVPGKVEFFPRKLPPQLILYVNGRKHIPIEGDPVRNILGSRAVSGKIRFGGGEGNPFVGKLDEIRISKKLRKYYERKTEWTNSLTEKDIVRGQPYLRDEKDVVFHAGFNGNLKDASPGGPKTTGRIEEGEDVDYRSGVVDQGILVGSGKQNPAFPAKDKLRKEEGTVEFWCRPKDWDNRRVQGFNDNMEFVPLVRVTARDQLEPGSRKVKQNTFLSVFFKHKRPRKGVEPPLLRPGEWYHIVATWEGNEKKVYFNGEKMPGNMGGMRFKPEVSPEKCMVSLDPVRAGFRYRHVHTVIDDLRFYKRALTPQEIQNAYARYGSSEKSLRELPFVYLKPDINVPKNKISFSPELLAPERGQVETGSLSLSLNGGEKRTVLEDEQFNFEGDTCTASRTFEDLDLAYGTYEGEFVCKTKDGKVVHTRKISKEKEEPPWYKNDIGVHKGEVLPNWEPMEVEGSAVQMEKRKIVFAPSGFPEKLISRGENILNAPMAAKLKNDQGEPIQLTSEKSGVQMLASHNDRVISEGEESKAGWRVNTRVRTEFDGMMKVKATLQPPEEGKQKLNRFHVDIPVKSSHALFYGMWTGHRNFRAGTRYGLFPHEEGTLFSSLEPGEPKCGKLEGSFIPYLHIAGDRRGLAWFAENDKGWTKTTDVPAVRVFREGDTTTLRLNIISKPETIKESKTFVFGLQLTPVKEVPEDRRSKTKNLHFAWVDGFSGISLKSYSAGTNNFRIYPRRYDWEAAEERMEYHQKRTGEHAFKKGYEKPYLYIDRNWVSLPRNAREYYDIWYDGAFRYLPDARDCYIWNMDEWIKRDLISGIYIDDAWINVFKDPETGPGYTMENGEVQPGFEFFDYRKFMKRLRWTFHENDQEPFIWVHMTQGFYLPILSFADVILDGEWKFPPWGQERDFLDKWRLGRLRHNHHDKWGLMAVWMNKIGKGEKAPMPMPHWEYHQQRSYRAGIMLHDIPNVGGTFENFQELGCYRDETEFIGYWEEESPVKPAAENAHVSVYRTPEDQLAVLAVNGNSEKARVIDLKVATKQVFGSQISLDELHIEDHDSYDRPKGQDVTKIETPDEADASPEEFADAESSDQDEDLLAEFEKDVEEGPKDEDKFEFTNDNYRLQNGAIQVKIRPHDYRLLMIREPEE